MKHIYSVIILTFSLPTLFSCAHEENIDNENAEVTGEREEIKNPDFSRRKNAIEQQEQNTSCNINTKKGEFIIEQQDGINVTILNRHSSEAIASFHIQHQTQYGLYSERLIGDNLEAGKLISASISADDMSLPNGVFDVSGSIKMMCLIETVGGRKLASENKHLYFHKDGNSWVFYDDKVRISKYNRGAISTKAVERKIEIESELKKRGDDRPVDMTGVFQDE